MAALGEIERCFGGAIPAVLATASADGTPNVTYISRAHQVDAGRVALSNQFMSKTARNLAENPRASLILMDPITHDEFRLSLVYERTERRGHVFERLKTDIEALAALEGMQDVYRLRAADIFRVVDIAQAPPNPAGRIPDGADRAPSRPADLAALSELAGCIARAGDVDVLVDVALDGLDRLLGYRQTQFLLVDEARTLLYAVAGHGFSDEAVGAEVAVGDGPVGLAAERCEVIRVGHARQLQKYSRSIREQYEQVGIRPGRSVPLPQNPNTQSRIAVPAMALGQLVGVLVAESSEPAAYGVHDEHVLGVVATLLAQAIEQDGALDRAAEPEPAAASVDAAGAAAELPPPEPAQPERSLGVPERSLGVPERPLGVKVFAEDGSVFVDGDYLIRGVAGRILLSLLRANVGERRVDFTNRELRRDPTLELPGYKDNLESRLLLLKRRLDERELPVRIHKTSRGRFRLDVSVPVRLDVVEEPRLER